MNRLCLILAFLLTSPGVASADEPASAYGPALFMPVARESAVACTYRSKVWNVRQAIPPLPDGTRPRFARLHLGAELKARVELPVDPAVPPRLMLERDGVVLNGGVESRDLLFPHKPQKVSHVLYTSTKTRLRWLGGKAGRVQVGIPEVDEAYRAHKPIGRAYVMCADVGLEEGDAGRFRRAHGIKRHAESHWVLLKEELSVSAEPGGGPKLFLPPAHQDTFFDTDSGREMYFIKLKEGRMKILTWAWNHHIVGWVNARALHNLGQKLESVVDGEQSKKETAPPGTVKCPRDLKLYARTGGKITRVGLVRKGTKILPGKGRGKGWLGIKLPEARWFVMEPGAELLLRAKARKRCKGL